MSMKCVRFGVNSSIVSEDTSQTASVTNVGQSSIKLWKTLSIQFMPFAVRKLFREVS